MKWYFKIIIFFIILAILVELLAIPLFPNKKNLFKYGFFNSTMFELLNEEENTIDTLMVGDSLIYSSISPTLIYDKYGFTSYDCSLSSQTMKESYQYLTLGIKSQNPKVVFLETNMFFRDPDSNKRKIKDIKKVKYMLPFYVLHNNWKKILGGSDAWIDYNKGFRYIAKFNPAKKSDIESYRKDRRDDKTIIKDENMYYLKKIIELCDEHNIKLILISNPSIKAWSMKKHEIVSKIAKDYNLEWLDLNTLLDIDWVNDTKDKGEHLNHRGAEISTYYVGEYLLKSNLVVSHKNDPKYQKWDRAVELYKENNKETKKEKILIK